MKSPTRILTAVVALAFSSSALADQDPCASSVPHAAMLACETRVAAREGKALQDAFENAKRCAAAFLAQSNADLSGPLDASQAAWEHYATAECDLEGETDTGAAGPEPSLDICRARLRGRRADELRAFCRATE